MKYNGTSVGTLKIPKTVPEENSENYKIIGLSFSGAELQVADAFESFLGVAVMDPEVVFEFEGTTYAVVESNMGSIPVEGVPFASSVRLRGRIFIPQTPS